MYEVVILNSAAKQLRNLDKPIKNKIIKTLEKIAENPLSLAAKTGCFAIPPVGPSLLPLYIVSFRRQWKMD